MGRFRKKMIDIFSFVKIDYSFFVLLILFWLLGELRLVFIYFFFLISHEISHLIVAKKLGYFPKRLKLSAFGASLEGFDDFLISDEIKIVLAGPIFNLVAIVLCYLSFWFYPESFCFLNDILFVNQTIFLFNMVPIFPLDAGRLLLCFISQKVGRRKAVKIVKKISFYLIILMFILSLVSFFFYFNFTLGFVALNLCILLFESASGTSFKREVLLRKKIERLGKGVSQKTIYVDEFYPVQFLLKFIDGEHYFVFVFVDKNFEEKRRLDEFKVLKQLGFI